MATGATRAKSDKGANNATKDCEDDVPKVQEDAEPQMMNTCKKNGIGSTDDEAPRPEGFYEKDAEEELVNDEAEDRDNEEQTHSSKDDDEAMREADAKEKARYQRRLEFMMDQDESNRRNDKYPKEVTLKVKDANGEALAEGQAVGKADAGSEGQPPNKPSHFSTLLVKQLLQTQRRNSQPQTSNCPPRCQMRS